MKTTFAAVLLAALAAAPAAAQGHEPGPHSPPREHDPLGHLLFPPEHVLQHAQELGLQPAQRATIVAAIKDAQGDLLDLQLQMSDRSQELEKIIGEANVNEAAALAQVDKVLTLEREVKRRQMQLLIRIKNTLTPEQQQRLAAMRDRGSPGE